MIRSLIAVLGLGRAAGITPESPGGATTSLIGSFSRVALVAAIVWQAVMLIIALATSAPGIEWVALAQAAVGLLAVAALRSPRLWPVVPVGMVSAATAGFVVTGDIDGVLTFASCWQINFAWCIAGLLLLRRYLVWLAIGSSIIVAITIAVFLPHWGFHLPMSIVITQTSITVALRIGLSGLLRHAAATDAAIRSADADALRAHALAFQSSQLAEESRTLHDTAINTLAAIAVGGAGTADARQVRAQCARDVELLDELRGHQRGEAPPTLAAVFDQPGLPIRRRGIDDAEIDRLSTVLAAGVVDAVIGCVREAVNNATKHSGAAHLDIELTTTASSLEVRVVDDGRGFDRSAIHSRGLLTSIEHRARDQGIVAEVRSTPGSGTTVDLTVPLLAPEGAAESPLPNDEALSRAAADVRRRSGGYWALGVTTVGIVLTVTGGANDGLALIPMVAVMLVAWATVRTPRSRESRLLLPLFLVIATVVVFVLSGRATAYGLVGATHWQALAATGPFVLLLSVTPRRGWRAAGATLWIGAVIVMAITMASTSMTAATIVVVAGLVGLGFSTVWAQFQRIVTELSDAASDSRRAAFDARLRDELTLAAQERYRRWIDAGLDTADSLLRDIRDGVVAPNDPMTKAACDSEERYLRQLVRISPELIHVGGAFIPLLRRARELGIVFSLRLGDQDARDDRVAADLADLVRVNLSADRASSLSASLFPAADGLHLTMTGTDLRVPATAPRDTHVVRLGSLDLLEATFRGDETPSYSSESDRGRDATSPLIPGRKTT